MSKPAPLTVPTLSVRVATPLLSVNAVPVLLDNDARPSLSMVKAMTLPAMAAFWVAVNVALTVNGWLAESELLAAPVALRSSTCKV